MNPKQFIDPTVYSPSREGKCLLEGNRSVKFNKEERTTAIYVNGNGGDRVVVSLKYTSVSSASFEGRPLKMILPVEKKAEGWCNLPSGKGAELRFNLPQNGTARLEVF